MKNKILTGYKRQNDNAFITIVGKIITKMDGNTNFSNPPAALAILIKLLPEFQAAVIAAADGDRILVSIKNDKRAAMEAALSELADFVTQVAKGDRTLLLSSGFDLNSSRADTSLGAITALQVAIDRPNEAITRIKRVRGARAYIHQYTPDPVTPDSVWTSKVITDTSYTFTGLQSKEKYVFQVIAVGYKGQEAYSSMVSKVIQ